MHQNMTRTPRRFLVVRTADHSSKRKTTARSAENGAGDGQHKAGRISGDVIGALTAFAGVMQVTQDPTTLRCRRPLLDRCLEEVKHERARLARLLADKGIKGKLARQVNSLRDVAAVLARNDGGVLTVAPTKIEEMRRLIETVRSKVHAAVTRAEGTEVTGADQVTEMDDDEKKKKGKRKQQRQPAQLRVSLAGFARDLSGQPNVVATAEQETDEGDPTEAEKETAATTLEEPNPAEEVTVAVTTVELIIIAGGEPCGNPCGDCPLNGQCRHATGDDGDSTSETIDIPRPGDPYREIFLDELGPGGG